MVWRISCLKTKQSTYPSVVLHTIVTRLNVPALTQRRIPRESGLSSESVTHSGDVGVVVVVAVACPRDDGGSSAVHGLFHVLLHCEWRHAQALSELMERSVSQLLSVRREHNCTKLDVDELKHLWDITVAFVQVSIV